MALRKCLDFRRYAFSVQYNGSQFLGFTAQSHENSITPEGTDLRNVFSVEGRIRQSLHALVDSGDEVNFENFQVSSRTDRGVHGIKNTFHVDIRPRSHRGAKDWDPFQLARALNHHLVSHLNRQDGPQQPFFNKQKHAIKITSCRYAPTTQIANKFYTEGCKNQPEYIDWNARFTATSRTYVYRILTSNSIFEGGNGQPFEDEYTWSLYGPKSKLCLGKMRQAANHLVGTYDFTSFRSTKCQRRSPIVTIQDIHIDESPIPLLYNSSLFGGDSGCSKLITVTVKGNAFLYRQVRNMVGCLVATGQGKLSPADVHYSLHARDRRLSPQFITAPPQGLFLYNVEHGDFHL